MFAAIPQNKRLWVFAGTAIATLAGIAFFFLIIGVFGLPASLLALATFIALALLTVRLEQD